MLTTTKPNNIKFIDDGTDGFNENSDAIVLDNDGNNKINKGDSVVKGEIAHKQAGSNLTLNTGEKLYYYNVGSGFDENEDSIVIDDGKTKVDMDETGNIDGVGNKVLIDGMSVKKTDFIAL